MDLAPYFQTNSNDVTLEMTWTTLGMTWHWGMWSMTQWPLAHWRLGDAEVHVPGGFHMFIFIPGADLKMERTFTKWKDTKDEFGHSCPPKSWTAMLTIENWAQPPTTNGLVLCDLLYHDHDDDAAPFLFDFIFQKRPQMLQLQLLLGSSKGRIQCQCEWPGFQSDCAHFRDHPVLTSTVVAPSIFTPRRSRPRWQRWLPGTYLVCS